MTTRLAWQLAGKLTCTCGQWCWPETVHGLYPRTVCRRCRKRIVADAEAFIDEVMVEVVNMADRAKR